MTELNRKNVDENFKGILERTRGEARQEEVYGEGGPVLGGPPRL